MYMELEPTEYGIELQKEIQRLIENTQQRKLAPKIAQLIIEMMHAAVIDCSDEVIYQDEQEMHAYTADEYFLKAYGIIKD
jgi:hypothetical protein